MKNFRTYQLALELYKAIETTTVSGPARDQIRRASLSIVLNLAEGSAKPTRKDRHKFYRIALGSLRETQCLLDILGKQKLAKLADQVGANLYKLCKAT